MMSVDILHIRSNQYSSQTTSIMSVSTRSIDILLTLIHEVKDPISHQVTRQRLIKDISRMNYGGKTPCQILSRQLQDLREEGKIEFIARGVYKTLVEDTNTHMVKIHPQLMEDLSNELLILSNLSGYGTLPEIQRRLALLHKMICSI
jgi:hypothetical protein